MKTRKQLTLASAKTAADTAPVKATPAPAAKRPYDHTAIREFTFPDGRPISIHRHSIRFATPLKDDPEHATLVSTKEGASPMPLKVTYADFMAWWKGAAA